MTMNANTTSPRPYGRVVLAWIIGFFLTFIVVDIIFVTLAVSTQTGLVTEQPYEKGLAYNDAIAAARTQNSWGWQGQLSSKGDDLVFILQNDQGHTINLDQIQAHLTRPTQQKMDRPFIITIENNGHARGNLSDLPPGQWRVHITATAQGRVYLFEKTIIIP